MERDPKEKEYEARFCNTTCTSQIGCRHEMTVEPPPSLPSVLFPHGGTKGLAMTRMGCGLPQNEDAL